MAKFGTFEFGEEEFGEGGVSPGPTPIPEPSRVGWRFFDGLSTYILPVNPHSARMPTRRKRVTHKPTCAGRNVTFEGRPETQDFDFSGVILSEAQYRLFVSWASKRKQIQVTDDLGRQYWVYIENFSPTRKKVATNPWYMDYTISGVALDRG